MAEIPFYLEAQLKNMYLDARSLADTKQLGDVYEVELFSLERAVQETLRTRSASDGRSAMANGRKLIQLLKDAPDKSGGRLVR